MCLCMGLFSPVFMCMCVLVSICRGNIATANKLRDCFALSKHPGWKKLSWEINKSGVMLSLAFFSLLLMAQEVFNHVLFFFHLAPQLSGQPNQPHWWVTSVILSVLVCIFLLFTISQLQCLVKPYGAINAELHSPQLLPSICSLLEKKYNFLFKTYKIDAYQWPI